MKNECEICHGSGQTCSFNGVSRFLLTWEECPACSGFGFKLPAPPTAAADHCAPRPPAPSTRGKVKK